MNRFKSLYIFCFVSILFLGCVTETNHYSPEPEPQPYPPATINEYEVKFVYFTPEQHSKFRQTMLDLKEKVKILPGGSESPGLMVYRIKNVRDGYAQTDVINIIQEYAESNELLIDCIQTYPGIMVFEVRSRTYDD